jgi:hypothetical protein
MPLARQEHAREVPETLIQQRNRAEGRQTYLQRHPELADFYNDNDRFTPSNEDRNDHTELLDELEDWEFEALRRAVEDDEFVYFVDFHNLGGLPTPLPLLITFVDGSEESITLPAEIWRRNHRKITRMFIRDKAIDSISLDPLHETADADFSNNHFPRRIERSRLELYRDDSDRRDLMLDMLEKLRERKTGKSGEVRVLPLVTPQP